MFTQFSIIEMKVPSNESSTSFSLQGTKVPGSVRGEYYRPVGQGFGFDFLAKAMLARPWPAYCQVTAIKFGLKY